MINNHLAGENHGLGIIVGTDIQSIKGASAGSSIHNKTLSRTLLTITTSMHSPHEPPQNPNKRAKKMFFFHGNFNMVRTRIEKSLTPIALHAKLLMGAHVKASLGYLHTSRVIKKGDSFIFECFKNRRTALTAFKNITF